MSIILATTLLLATTSLIDAATPAKRAHEPLASKHFTYPNLPFQVTGPADAGPRGAQIGYNICNSTTENQQSKCQTAFINDITDFCMWAPDPVNGKIEDTEAEEVAWCSKKGHGTRIIPSGALTGVQLVYAKGYIQIAGWVDLPSVNIAAGNGGGELDPHGADGDGNPIGGVMFSNGFGQTAAGFKAALGQPSSTNYQQVIEWTDFIGSAQDPSSPALGRFCLKVCNPSNPKAPQLCEHRYDRVGCDYNAPAAYADIKGKFEVCDSDDMIPVGTYVVNGVTSTWTQPPESLGPITTIPYTPVIPQSSNCQQFQSSQLFATAGVPVASSAATPVPSSSSAGPSSSGASAPSSNAASRSGSSSSGSAPPAQTSKPSGANSLVPAIVGVIAMSVSALLVLCQC